MTLFARFDICGPDGSLYLRRWTLLKVFGWKLTLHRIVRPDYARDLHDHPWSFVTLVLRGGYVERMRDRKGLLQIRVNRPGRIRVNRAPHAHVIDRLPDGEAWTLVLHGRDKREWGFHTDCGWMHWRKYCDRVYAGRGPSEESEGKRD